MIPRITRLTSFGKLAQAETDNTKFGTMLPIYWLYSITDPAAV
jgi:hypothetical protein